ncbi:MAG: hypothetical protein GXC94_01730 [Comamonadaceae bacterium]|jgi:hypothetical protein|nr:hypothetical protein [Comamonadaceae bacterium]
MDEYQILATPPAQQKVEIKHLERPLPDFASTKATTYAGFEAARREASAVIEATPLVRWANVEFNKER